ncbi:phosphotransferase family protein [Paraglaciecola polaris]|uniref:Aminoglycoside phosphotransferase n=1 Tax=Paraglaciecola polaris LMG 21857 TaxID=1129793 RepID=K6ZFB5_9ALTE|nr:phosphotransferase family protein [Paraglaciecola polaris]GAC34736.1 aminoglycoside phosphotransferase [Paraglaciecola polaris LMG 21857]|tara:strand:+ start:3832 stop:4866 length:1035 start_codon:yes stop_codon:yes gene_type:complete
MSKQSGVEQLDEARLATYLAEHIAGFSGPVTATKFAGGQSNPTFKLQTADATYVLRRQPPGKLLKSAHAVDREYRVLKALENSQAPVAKVYHLCEDPEVIGSMFYVMEFMDGNVYWDSSLPEITDNQTRATMYQNMVNVLAALHKVNIEEVGLGDYGKPGNYFERQISRWTKQYRLSETHEIPEMDKLITWLENNIPEDDGQVSLVHGDYRMDNLMFAKDSADIIAVLDWELSTLGHPYADLAYQCMQLRLPDNVGKATGLGDVDRASLGIPSEEEYVAQYCKLVGIDNIPNWNFYLAFSFFRLGAIAQGVAKRAVDGNASNKQALQVGKLVQPLAQYALKILQ